MPSSRRRPAAGPLAALRKKIEGSLLARVTSSFLALTVLIVLLLSVISTAFLLSNAVRHQEDMVGALASVKVGMLNRWVIDQRSKVEFIARLGEVRSEARILCDPAGSEAGKEEAHRSLKAFFTILRAYNAEIKTASLLSMEGARTVFSTEPGREGQYHPLDKIFTVGGTESFLMTMHPSTATILPTMAIATPVRDAEGRTLAVLAVDLALEEMDRIVQDRTGLGRTGEAYLVDRYGLFVSAERFGRGSDPRGASSPGIDRAVRGESGVAIYQDHAGIPVIGAYRWISAWELALLVEIRRGEVYRTAWTQSLAMTGIGSLLALAMAIGVYGLSRRLTRPILAVQQAALRVSSGELDAKAPVLTTDEIGVLARSFNRMTTTVKLLYEEQKRREEHFRALIESSMDMVAVLDAGGRFSFVSPSVERLSGFSAAELLGRECLRFIHPDDMEKTREGLASLRVSGDGSITASRFRFARKAGGWFQVECGARNLTSHPSILGIVLNARDVTERDQLEDKLLQSQKMEAVGHLAGGVAHDFNNLLTVVIGYCDALAASPDLASDPRQYVGEIRKAADRAASLTQQLLAYSRKQIMQPRAIDLNALLSNLQSMLRRLIGEDVRMRSVAAPDLKGVRADPNQIEQVVMNLATNARDAMPQGGDLVFETRNAVLEEAYCRGVPDLAPGEYVMLAVSDTGIGMDESTRRRLFEPFFTTKGLGKGTGLGLATAYGIVKQSGGHIAVESVPGRGSTFSVYLPARPPRQPPRAEAGVEGAMARGSEEILVVEDEEPLRRMVCLILAHAGYGVHAAESAEEALPMAAGLERFDLLLTDVTLPGRNGKELADEIRAGRPAVRTLFISGYTESAIGEHGFLAEGIDFLQKPFTPKVLARKVREILDRA